MRPFTPSVRQRPDPLPKPPSSPVKSILRQPTSLGKRESDSIEPGDSPTPTSPTKRRKVLFDEVLNITHEVDVQTRTLDDVKLEVRTALERHLKGVDAHYDSLKEIFSNERQGHLPPLDDDDDGDDDESRPSPDELRLYLVALTACAPLLKNKACNGLVRLVLNCAWLGRDDSFTKAYIQFLAALVSVQGSYLATVIDVIVDKFTLVQPSQWEAVDFPRLSRQAVMERVHSALQYLLNIFPAANTVLTSAMSSNFPYRTDSRKMHLAFVKNCLRVRRYAPAIEKDILDLIVHHVVQIDVEMQVDLDDVEDDRAAAVQFALENGAPLEQWEDEADSSDDESVDSDDSTYDREAAEVRSMKRHVETMDGILQTLFHWYQPHFNDPRSDEAQKYYGILMSEFTNIILPTRKSRHTQFLLFHFGQLSDRLLNVFLGTLMRMAFQTNQPTVTRQAAILYISSFVARASTLSTKVIREVFASLISQLSKLRQSYEPKCKGPDLKRYLGYYTLFQGIIYIFCFRWKDLVASAPDTVDPDEPASYIGQELEWLSGMKEKIQASIFGKMNPLKVCCPAIVDEFAKLSQGLGFLYVYSLIETNKRVRLVQYLSGTYGRGNALRDSGAEKMDESYHQLEPYFPFDPSQLPNSKAWMQQYYNSWRPIPGLNSEDEDDNSDGEDGEHGEDEEDEEQEGESDNHEEDGSSEASDDDDDDEHDDD